MKTIGITGGVGAGKSQILDYLAENCNCTIIKSDKLAYELESPGHECYDGIVTLLGKDILDDTGFIIRRKMAEKIFSDQILLEKVNSIIHPAVKKEIFNRIKIAASEEKDYFFLEAALLIEEGYENILDELWYIRTDENVRRERLKASRGYSDEKIDSILKSQLSDDEFMRHCKCIIDNSGNLEKTFRQIDEALKLGE